MFITVTNGRVVLKDSVWDKEKKCAKTVQIKSFGRRDAMSDEEYEALRAAYQVKSSRGIAKKMTEELIAKTSSHADQVKGGLHLRQYGHLLIRQILIKHFNFEVWVKRLLKKAFPQTEVNYVDLLLMQIANRVCCPSSLLEMYRLRSQWLGNPIDDQLRNTYRLLPVLSANKQTIMNYVGKQLRDKDPRSLSIVYYDVTNTWFETPYSDEEKNDIRVSHYAASLANDENLSDSEREAMVESYRKSLRAPFRMRGLNKQLRCDMPQVSLALAIDRNGMVVDFFLYPGNTSEFETIQESVHSVKENHGARNSIIVTDRGLNSRANLQLIEEAGYHFLSAQKITGLGKELTDQMLSSDGWISVNDGFRYKELQYTKKGRNQKPVECKLIVTFSKDRHSRDLHELEEDLELANNAIRSKREMSGSRSGWASLVTVSGKSIAKGVSEAKVEKRKKFAGLYGIVVSKDIESVDEATGVITPMSPLEVVDIYSKLVNIEANFRAMKHTFDLRPMYVRKPEHIEAHCLLCILALIVTQLIQREAQKMSGIKLSADVIAHILGRQNVAYFPKYEAFYFPALEGISPDLQTPFSTLNKLLHDIAGLTCPEEEEYTLAELGNLLKKRYRSIEEAVTVGAEMEDIAG